MKKLQGFVVGILLLAASQTALPAQTQTLLTAEEAPVEMVLLQPEEIPVCGTFYLLSDLAQTPAGAPPYPCVPPKAASAPVFQIEDNLFVVDDLAANQSVFESASVNSITAELEEQVQSLVQSVRTARANGAMSLAVFGTEFETQSTMSFAETYSTDDLWLELVSKTNELANFMIHPPAAEEGSGVYDLFMTTSLTAEGSGLNGTNWLWLLRTSPGQTNVAYSPLLDEICFFRLARTNDADADGLSDALEHLSSHTDANNADENTNGIPDGWEWLNFGDLNQTANGDYDGDGIVNGLEYTNGTDPNTIAFRITVTNQYSKENIIPLQLNVTKGLPFQAALVVDNTNNEAAVWLPYNSSNLMVNLGMEGWHSIRVGLRGRTAAFRTIWQSRRLKLDVTPPILVIESPINGTISQPMIQIKGYSLEQVSHLAYNLTNASGFVANKQVLILDRSYDTNTLEFTTNYFHVFDVSLTAGLNAITLQATDLAGNVTVSNFSYTVDYSNDTNPPAIVLGWPRNGTCISGNRFNWRGWIDDATAQVSAQTIETNGTTNNIFGRVGRDGDFWIENVPLRTGTNSVALVVTDFAGNSKSTVVNLIKSDLTLTASVPEMGFSRIYAVGMGSAPASGAISRALAADCEAWNERTVWCWCEPRCSARGRAELQPRRLRSQNP